MAKFDQNDHARVENDPVILGLEQARVGFEQLEAQLKAKSGPQDGRTQAANRIRSVIQSAMTFRIVNQTVLPSASFWEMFFGVIPSSHDLTSYICEAEVATGFIAFQGMFSALESDLRTLLRALDPGNAGTGDFYGLSKAIMVKAPSVAGFDDFLNLLRLVRNTVHNNGTYRPKQPGDRTIVYGAKTYVFSDRQPVKFVGWTFIIWTFDEVRRLLTALTSEPAVAGLASVPV
jgi:hypothetical protein